MFLSRDQVLLEWKCRVHSKKLADYRRLHILQPGKPGAYLILMHLDTLFGGAFCFTPQSPGIIDQNQYHIDIVVLFVECR